EKIQETRTFRLNGFLALAIELALGIGAWQALAFGREWEGVALLVVLGIAAAGFFVVPPNTAKALVFLGGKYIGSVRESGFWWANPLAIRKKVSLRVHNFNSEKLKVNDAQGNPIEIGAVVVWRVVDSAKALFEVEDYREFVSIQSESAIRNLATRYPYDAQDEERPSLRENPTEVADHLRHEVQERLEVAGVDVIEARLTHLAYAPEIAQAMLRRQQAAAIIAARQKIVEGAVGMVETALRMLSESRIIELDEERKAAMVNNLLVALTAEQEVQPVINTGTIYG
ncbi:MAG: SPFH domain-containing protein, partial [Gemmatimonadota bacterium]